MRILVYRYMTRLQNGCHYKLRVGSDSSQWWVDGRPCDSCQWHLCQHCQDIDQTKALEGLSKGLFLNLCWQAMTWWRRGWWIDCVLSLLSLFCSHSYFFRSLSPPLPLCPITLLSISPSPPASFFSSTRLYSSLECVERKMSDYFPADTALCDRGLELYITRWHFFCLPLFTQTTSNIARPFWSLKRLVLGEEFMLKQKQTKCFICCVRRSPICVR